MKRRYWTDIEIEIMKDMYPDHYADQVAEKLNRSISSIYGQAGKLKLKKSEAFMQSELNKQAERLRVIGVKSHFKKGQTPINKGKKMSADVYEKIKHTFFAKGHAPHNAYKDGHEVIRRDTSGNNYWMIKIPDCKRLIYKHIYIWTCLHGPVKPGYNIAFKDGNQLNCVIENLECISNAELMLRNTIHRFPQALKNMIRLNNKLNRTIDAKK